MTPDEGSRTPAATATERANPKLETLYRLAQALHVPVIALLPSIGVVPPRTGLEVTPDAAMLSTAVEIDLEPWLVEAR